MRRDAAIVKFMNGYIVNTCDSAGGIGTLKNDLLKIDVCTVAMKTLKVALLENISIGTKILSVNMGFANSPQYVKRAVEVVREFLSERKISLTISTEKNFSTDQTGIGVGVVGFAEKLRIGGANPGDGVYVMGIPRVGKEVIENSQDVVEIEDIIELMKLNYVGEIIPVGSQGIAFEANNLAKNSSLKFVAEENGNWMYKSAGPATCVVFSSKEIPVSKKIIRRVGWLK